MTLGILKMKRIAALMLVLAVCFSLAACKNRTPVYERKTPVYLETPEPKTDSPWGDGKNSTPVPVEEETPTPGPSYTFSGYAFCVMNAATGEVVLGKNENDRNYIASITKLLTCLTALDYLSPEESVKIEPGWLDFLKKDESIECYGFKEGSTQKVDDLVCMALIRSFGDAAVVLGKAAEVRAGRSFIDLMNEKALLYGMYSSHFDNVIGLDIGNNYTENYSTAADAARLMKEALKNETVMRASAGKSIKLSNGTTLSNTSSYLANGSNSDLYEIIGGKTGSTKAAGSNLALAVRNTSNGDIYAVVYLHASGVNVLAAELHEIIESVCGE